jgi:hypothetical protein
MLYRNLLTKALEDKREDFTSFDRAWRDDVREMARLLRLLGQQTSGGIRQETASAAGAGALPSAELDSRASMVAPFAERWQSHEEARRWAIEALHERVTFAVDGSQLLPGREISLPVAAVQVAWFENPHTREGRYFKEADFSIISPSELLETSDGRINAETVVSFRRFELEVEALCKFLEKKSGWRGRRERTPVAFFDGSLTYLIAFALPKTEIQERYREAIVRLIRLSRETEVPVVGFIDQSYARDLVWLLEALRPQSRASKNHSLYDAQLLCAAFTQEPPLLAAWGDRTVFCYHLLDKMSDRLLDEKHDSLIGFIYLQTTGDGPPARLDLPSWIYEAGLLDDVVDAVRAECVGGLGYPYAIETADEAAVITAHDRAQFLRALQDFAEKESFVFRVSRKAASKVRRR